MTRRKVKLAFIVNPSDRKASYKKRKRGLMKKVVELSTLCGIEAAAVLYGPYDEKPVVWPEDPAALNQVLERFKAVPATEKGKRMVNQQAFTQQRIGKTNEQLKKILRDNREKEVRVFTERYFMGEQSAETLPTHDAIDVGLVARGNVEEISRRLAFLKNQVDGGVGGDGPDGGGGHIQVGDHFPPPPPPPPLAPADMSTMTMWMNPQMGGGFGDGAGGSSSAVMAPPPPLPPLPPPVVSEMMPMNIEGYHQYNQMQNYGFYDVGLPYYNYPYDLQMIPQQNTVNTNAGPSFGGDGGGGDAGPSYGGGVDGGGSSAGYNYGGAAGPNYGGAAGPSFINTDVLDPNYFNINNNNNNNGAGGSGYAGGGGFFP